MRGRKTNGLVALALVAAAGLPLAWYQAVATAEPSAIEAAFGTTRPSLADGEIRFNFKDVPFSEVLEFFSRESSLPIIHEAQVPEGRMTFIAAEAYSFREALSILNMNLRMHGVHLRKEDRFLHLRRLEDAAKSPTRVGAGELPDDILPDEMLTLTIPLSNAQAAVVAEQFKDLVSPYGAIMPVPQQNMLIVMESAGQARRLMELVRMVDDVRPRDSEFRLFALKHAEARTVVQALESLLGGPTRQVIVDNQGRPHVIDDPSAPELNVRADQRMNAVVAVGPLSQIKTVEELVSLLDVPEDGGDDERAMKTFTLETITPQEAERHLQGLFRAVPERRRPTVIPLPEAGKISIVGPRNMLARAASLLGEVDPMVTADGDRREREAAPEQVTRILRLEHATPAAVEQVAGRLLSPRQSRVLRWAPTPDGRGLVVSGPPSDVDSFEHLIEGLDTERELDRQVRVVRIAEGDPAEVLEEAAALFKEAEGDRLERGFSYRLDEDSRRVTVVGTNEAIRTFEDMIRAVESGVVVEREKRRYEVEVARPSDVAESLRRLVVSLLRPEDESPFVEPEFEALDDIDTLVVRAVPEHFGVIESLIERLDAEEPGGREFRIIRLSGVDPEDAVRRAMSLYERRTEGLAERDAGRVETEIDEQTGSVLVTARPAGMRIFAEVLGEVQRLTPPERTARFITLEHADAASLIEPVRELLEEADPIDPSRRIEPPTLRVVERTNSLLVTAELAQHEVIRDIVSRLDTVEVADVPPPRLLQLRTADANSIAQVLREQYDRRPRQERTARPVDVRADGRTNTLIVSAHHELFDEIRDFVSELNEQRRGEPERVTVLFNLQNANAESVARAMNELYPAPPVPTNQRGQPQPWLQEPQEVRVSADAETNALIIDAPSERIESLKELAERLDQVEVPGAAELRTFRVVRADLDAVARTLQGMARRGALSADTRTGRESVLIETEPRSSTLIVAGDEVTFERVQRVLEDLDEVRRERGVRIVPIANADAARIAERAREIYEAKSAGRPEAEPIDIRVDEETNTLSVVGEEDSLEQFVAVIEQLERQAGPEREVRMIELRFARVDEAIELLEEMVRTSDSLRREGGRPPSFEAVEAANALLISAQPGQFPVIEQVVRGIDRHETAEKPPLRILRLRTTDAAAIASVLQRAYEDRPPEQRARHPVDIQADSMTNTLIVSAHPEVLPEIEDVVSDLNKQREVDADGREIRIFPLRVARAEELAETIDRMFPEPPMPVDPRGRPLPHLKQEREVVVRADRATNSLIVDAPAHRLAGFERIVESLDQTQLHDDVELRTYSVARAELESVANTIRQLADGGALPVKGRAPITVSTESASRSLIVSGPSEIFGEVERVLDRLDTRPEWPSTALKMYTLEHTRADRIQPLLERLLTTRLREVVEGEAEPVHELETLLDVAADMGSNTLIVSAPEPVQQIAEQLIRALDTEESATGRPVVRVVPLAHADAAEVAASLRETIPTMELHSGQQPSVVPASGSNALILAGAQKDLEAVEALIEPLDRPTTDAEAHVVETFELEHADAAALAPVVERLLSQQGPDANLLRMGGAWFARQQLEQQTTDQPRVESDERTNTLLVSAPKAKLELVRSIVDRLDQPDDERGRVATPFHPEHADPASLAETVGRILSERESDRRMRAELLPDRASGTVVAVGPRDAVTEALRLLADFDDRTPPTPEIELAVFQLEKADAQAVASTMQGLLSDRGSWPETLRRAEEAGRSITQPSVNVDGESNRLLISAPSALMPVARQIVETLDRPAASAAVEVRVFRLRKGNATSVADALRESLDARRTPGKPSPRITPEPKSNAIVVAATGDMLEHAEALIASLDDSVEPDQIGVRTIYLRHARAEAVAPIVEQTLSRQGTLDMVPQWARIQLLQGDRDDRGVQVQAVAERRLNAVVISAPMPVLELAEQIVGELDVEADERRASRRTVQVVRVQNADAAELAESLREVFDEDDAAESPPVIRVDRASNTLIVRGTADQASRIEELAKEVDRATLTSSREMRTVPIDRSRAEALDVARTLKRLMERDGDLKVEVISAEELMERHAPREEGGERGDAAPFPGTLSPSLPGRPGAVWDWVAHAGIAAAGAEPEPAGEGDRDGGGATLTIAVDPATNSLLIIGGTRLAEEAIRIAADLEASMPPEPGGVRVVGLPENVEANAVLGVMRETIRQVGQAGPENPGGFTGTVSVMGDPTGTGLVVWANDTDFETVGRLISALASPAPEVELMVRFYPLESISARQAERAINDLISASPRGAQARRLRKLDLDAEDGRVQAAVDPELVRVTIDPGGTGLIVTAPEAVVPLLDSFVSVIDQSPVADRLAIRRYTLNNARAPELAPTFQQLLDAQRQQIDSPDLPQARFVVDQRTNSLLVTASRTQHKQIESLLDTVDVATDEEGWEFALFPLERSTPSAAQRIIEQILVGRDAGRAERLRISTEDDAGLLIVRGPAEDVESVRDLIERVDSSDARADLPVHTIRLERADAAVTADRLNDFLRQRAEAAGRRDRQRFSIVGDRRSGALIIAATEEDLEDIRPIAEAFDAPLTARDMHQRVINLEHASASDLKTSLEELMWQIIWDRRATLVGQQEGDTDHGQVFMEAIERTNSIVLLGRGDFMETMEGLIEKLDVPRAEQTMPAIRSIRIEGVDPQAVAGALEAAYGTPGWTTWRGRDPEAISVQVDRTRRVLIIMGKAENVNMAVEYVEQLTAGIKLDERLVEAVNLEHARADRAAESVRRFLVEKARAEGIGEDHFSVVGSPEGNVLLISADEPTMGIVQDIIAQIDKPELGEHRRIEVYALRHADTREAASTLRAMFPDTGRRDEQLLVTPQPSRNSLIVSAPEKLFTHVDKLITQLDSAPSADDANIVAVTLSAARASDVARSLQDALPDNINVRITPVTRSNSLLLTGTEETIAIVMEQIEKLDKEPTRSLQQFRRFVLQHAEAIEVNWILRDIMRERRGPDDPRVAIDYTTATNTVTVSATSDQLEEIEQIIRELDTPPETERRTEFVRLEFADAEQAAEALQVFYGRTAPEADTPGARSVTIIPDRASNSLVISGDESQWEGIRALLAKLDTEEYDTSRQLVVIPLRHADATSVARALGEGFRAPLEQQFERERIRIEQQRRERQDRGRDRDREPDIFEPTVLVDAADVPAVSAEPQTNSLVVFAARRDLERIRALVEQLDVPEIAKMPPPRVIPVRAGRATALAGAVRSAFLDTRAGREGSRSLLIEGDDASGVLIVRAEQDEFERIRELAETLQDRTETGEARPRIIRVANLPASRLRSTLLETFRPVASARDESLAIEVDRATNALVVSASPHIFSQIQDIVRDLDGADLPALPDGDAPAAAGFGPGRGIFIIDVENNSPSEVKRLLEELGVTRQTPDDRQGLVDEPAVLVPLATRSALAVVASPRDGEAIVSLVRALDGEPAEAGQRLAIVRLKLAEASAVVRTLERMLDPGDQQAATGPAETLAEHVRRLSMLGRGFEDDDINLDLSKPIRLIPDEQTNAVIVASTSGNVSALRNVIAQLDELPLGDAVVVRIFPLHNASATRLQPVINQLFQRGEALRRLPGTQRMGLPVTATGQALAGEISLSVDDRTNALIVAGREEAVALVEVLIHQLDSDETASWVEPEIITLEHAEANQLATRLRAALVTGLGDTPEAEGLRRQVARLRMVRQGRDPQQADRIDSDLYAPLTGLVIEAEPHMNAILVIGTRSNIEITRELAGMLDVEPAVAGNPVRVVPLRAAPAQQVSQTLQQVFRQRAEAAELRPEDRLVIAAEPRTNSLVISTSERSFELLDGLLETIDDDSAARAVGLHVLTVDNADARDLAPRIQRLVRERIDAARRSGRPESPDDVFTIEPDAAGNLLLVAASEENLAIVEELVDALSTETAARESAETEIFSLSFGRASEVADALANLYINREIEQRGPGAVSVVPNQRLNALIVSGTPRDIREIGELVRRLDDAKVTAVQDLKRIELSSASATEVVRLLEEILAGPSLGGGGATQATRLRFFRDRFRDEIDELEEIAETLPTEVAIDGAIRDQVRITADRRTNSVLIAAPTAMVALIEDIVRDLDSTRAGEWQVEKFTLTNADARAMAEVLRGLFSLQRQGSQYVLLPTGGERDTEEETRDRDEQLLNGRLRPGFTPVPSEREELALTIDARTNTLLVAGTRQYIQRVGEIIRDLDEIEAAEREQTVFHLRNAQADELESILRDYFQTEADRIRQTLGPDVTGALTRQLEQEVTVVGDTKSNKLVVMSSPRYTDTVRKLVDELDASPPQVTIQVLIAEVTLDSEDTWGMDSAVGPFGGDNYRVGVTPAGAAVATALGVPDLSVSSNDFDLIVRALEVQGKLEVLSRPRVTVNNNEQAFIQVGEDIPIVTGVERLDADRTRAEVERRDIGIILTVTPSINPDGFVRMHIEPEISAIGTRGVQISEDFEAPRIQQRRVDTVVTVRDGQTVVVGGLIESQEEVRRTRMPIIGHIPILGMPFRTDQVSEVKTELLVLLTPRVIPGSSPSDLARQNWMTEYAIEQMSARERIRNALEEDILDPPQRELQTEPVEATPGWRGIPFRRDADASSRAPAAPDQPPQTAPQPGDNGTPQSNRPASREPRSHRTDRRHEPEPQPERQPRNRWWHGAPDDQH